MVTGRLSDRPLTHRRSWFRVDGELIQCRHGSVLSFGAKDAKSPVQVRGVGISTGSPMSTLSLVVALVWLLFQDVASPIGTFELDRHLSTGFCFSFFGQ